ncbi:MAG: aspartate aminotransferase family protein [Chloroflexi bacterium]|nr:aspartate aminotransferase family protein [Chloroflexota bacterium]
MNEWMELEKKYLMYNVARPPVVLIRGKGTRVWDDQGKEYLDFMAGWAVAALGHSSDVVVNALCEQARKLIHVSNQFYTIPQIQLAELLVQNTVFDKAFFANSGAEANEGAIKLARKYGKVKLNGAFEVITALHSFHGRTLAMVAATGKEIYQRPYLPLPAGFRNVEFNDLDVIKGATTADTCAVMLEAVQGEGGVNIAGKEYLQGVRQWCDEKGILMILDEVQTGIGRTGTFFAYQQYGIEPDILTMAKGLGGGVPIGGFLAKEKAAVFEAGDHGTTFGGNPLVCATAYATVKEVLSKDIPGHTRRMGEYLLQKFAEMKDKYSFIKGYRGLGLLAAMDFDQQIAKDVVNKCVDNGLLLNATSPITLRFMPPLIIEKSEIDEAAGILDNVLQEFQA